MPLSQANNRLYTRSSQLVGQNAAGLTISSLNDLSEAIADADLLLIDNGGDGGTNVKFAASRIPTYVFTKVSGAITINSSGVASLGTNAEGTNLTLSGNLTVNGTTTNVSSTTVTIDDPLFALADNNSADSVDIGWYGKYVDSGTKYSGLFRDASDSDMWKLFANTGNSNAAPSTTVDTTSGFTLANLSVNELTGTIATAAQGNITSLGTLSALTVDDVAIDGKVVTMTGSSGDTATITVGTNGTLDITTTDTAAAAANIQITADGTAELAGTTVTLDSEGGITLDANGGTITFADNGSSLGTITSSGYSGTAAIATTVTITDNESTNEDNAVVFTAGGDVDGGNLGLESDGNLTYNPSSGTLTSTTFSGNLTGNVTGTASIATTVTITDNESTNEDNAVVFTAGGDVDGGNLGLESDGNLTYNPSSGTLTSTVLSGSLAASNISDVASLSEISSVASDDVFIAIDTSGGGLKKITRSAIVAGLATSSAIANVSEDSTPQLGGDLDVNSNDIVSTSNGNISLLPNGSGKVVMDGNGSSGGISISDGTIDIRTGTGSVAKVLFYCEVSNAHAQTIQAQPHSAGVTNTLTLPAGGNGELVSTVATQTLTNKSLGSDLDIFDDANNADVKLTMGTSATESLTIQVLNGSSNKTAEEVHFSTATASSTANHGKMVFDVDGTDIVTIDDGGVDIGSGLTFSVNGTDIVTGDSLNSLSAGAIADGDSIAFIDANDSNATKKEAVADLATLFAGTGLTASSSVIGVDASQAITALTGGDLTIYEDANNADVSLKMGTSATEALSIEVLNGSSNKTAESVTFSTATASSTSDHGKFTFNVDGTDIFDIDDSGINLASGKTFRINGTAIDGDITSVVAGTGLTGGGTDGDVTLNVAAGNLIDVQADQVDVDLTEAGEAAIANGDYILFLDGGATGSHAKENIADVATLFAGTGLTATNSVIAVDSSQAITALTGGDLTIYEDANNADVSLKLGTSATESLSIEVLNGSSNKTAEEIHFSTATASSTANHGKMVFDIDGTDQMEINDSGVSITGDLTITGDDLFMNTNTAGHILVGDDTNYNPVAVSGDVTLASSGAVTIANDAVESGMLNDNVISGQTEISSGLADADELLYSDGGTLKKVGLDTLTTHINSTAASKGFATAMAIAL